MEQDSKSIVKSATNALAPQTQGLKAYAFDQAEEVPGLLQYWRLIQKRRMTILTVLIVTFTIGLIATLKEKRVYQAKALIEVQRENPDIPTLQDLFQVENVSDVYLETQYRILKSDNLARSVISQLNLNQNPEFATPRRNWLETAKAEASTQQISVIPYNASTTTKISDEVLKEFEKRLDVEPITRSRLIEISFESQDPRLAADVVNSLDSSFIEENVQARWQASQNASKWLGKQLLDMKAQLEKSEDELQSYASDNGLLFLETGNGRDENIVVQRLQELQDELTKAQSDLYEKQSRYRLVQQGDFASLPDVFGNKLMQDLTEKLAELESERSQLATTFHPAYPRLKAVQNQIDELESILSHQQQNAADTIGRNYNAAADRVKMLQEAFEGQQKEANLVAEKSVKYNILKREADTDKDLYVGLLQKLNQTEVSNSLKAANIRVVDTAYPPKKPVRPRILLNLSVAFVFGLCLGIGGAFIQEHLDNTFKTIEEVERRLRVPMLACIPALKLTNGHDGAHGLYARAKALRGDTHALSEAPHWNRIEGNGDNRALVEAFHALRTSVLLSTAKRPPTSLLITSAQPSEGKTTVAANLAISLAQLGERVLIIDADLRRPNVHSFFGVPNSRGLANFLTGNATWKSLLIPAAPSGLTVLPGGPPPPNPADLLSSESVATLIQQASEEFKFIVLDSPPLLNLADSRMLATIVDAVVLVVRLGHSPRDLVQRAYTSVFDSGSRTLGVTFNFADIRSSYYSYDYGENGRTA
jgi:polysaccharide biosynthesis transport protein